MLALAQRVREFVDGDKLSSWSVQSSTVVGRSSSALIGSPARACGGESRPCVPPADDRAHRGWSGDGAGLPELHRGPGTLCETKVANAVKAAANQTGVCWCDNEANCRHRSGRSRRRARRTLAPLPVRQKRDKRGRRCYPCASRSDRSSQRTATAEPPSCRSREHLPEEFRPDMGRRRPLPSP